MKQLMIALGMLGFCGSMALAQGPMGEPPKKEKEFEVLFACSFKHEHHKEIHCLANGEVNVKQKGHDDGYELVGGENDENRLRIVCTDGFYDDDRVKAKLKDGDEKKDKDDLVIFPKDKDDRDEKLVIKDIKLKREREGRDKDDDQDLDARLKLEDGKELCGTCDVEVSKVREKKPLL